MDHGDPLQSYMKLPPPEGIELNRPATLRLFNLFPRGLRTIEGTDRFEERLKNQVEAMHGEWVSYDRENGILTFKVEHF